MSLKHLTDKTLLEDTRRLASAEREITVNLLHHLKEIDRRKLFADLGYRSLYEYCVRDLKYSEGAAQRRISSARLLGEMPSLEMKIKNGALTLTNLASLSQFFREEKIVETEIKEEIVSQVEGLSRRECDLKLMQLSGSPIEPRHCLWISDSLMEKMKEYRALKGTSESMVEILTEAVTVALAELERMKFKLVQRPRASSISEGRTPTASVKREVYRRDKNCVNCGGKFGLQFDHRHPYALGGKSSPDNIQLVCHNCNQRRRIRQQL